MKKEEIEEIEDKAGTSEVGESSQEAEAEIGGQCAECNLQFDNREQLTEHFKVKSFYELYVIVYENKNMHSE